MICFLENMKATELPKPQIVNSNKDDSSDSSDSERET